MMREIGIRIENVMKTSTPIIPILLAFGLALALGGCSTTVTDGSGEEIVVNSLEDTASPAGGSITLRQAIADIGPGGTITFDPSLNGGTIELTIVGEAHSTLRGEVFTMGGGGWTFGGYQERDYGRSALYAQKDLTIDASGLPAGITIKWGGDDANRARVMAVYGDLTMDNVTVTSGYASWEALSGGSQPYTLGRGGGLAVWGTATLRNCALAGNRASGDENGSRDRGAFGGGVYANRVYIEDCVISGNSVIGYGAAGGGVYSVSGADDFANVGSTIIRTAVSGNRATGQHTYGGGVYSDGGGPGNTKSIELRNCTVARNLVEDHPGLAQSAMAQYYYRGGGLYMSNGRFLIDSCTFAENAVTGVAAIFSGKPNMGGGAMAATIGNAHVVESMGVWNSIIVGNTVAGEAHDLYSGSLVHFFSYGYNLIGKILFTHILVPIPPWQSLSRKHYPKVGDQDGLALDDVLDLGSVATHDWILSAGTDAGSPAVLWYPPIGPARDAVPTTPYDVPHVLAEYELDNGATDDFLNLVLEKLRTDHGDVLGADFGSSFGDLTGVTFHGPGVTWPTNPENAAWIAFWRELDVELGDQLGAVRLGDDFWGSYAAGRVGASITMRVTRTSDRVSPLLTDQLGQPRSSARRSVGAIED
jgi:hypothetical protein